MAALQSVTWTTGTSSGGTPNNLPTAMPAEVFVDDFLVCGIWNANITPPTGWTLRDSSNNVSDRIRLYTKTALGTEGGTTVNFTERAGTVSGLEFGAAVARYTFSADAIADPYTLSASGGQFGSTGGTPYTEIYNAAGGPFTDHAILCSFKMLWNIGVINPAPTYAIDAGNDHLEDLGSRVFKHSTTASNGTQDGRFIFIDSIDITGTVDSNESVTFTGGSGATDMTINGVAITLGSDFDFDPPEASSDHWGWAS